MGRLFILWLALLLVGTTRAYNSGIIRGRTTIVRMTSTSGTPPGSSARTFAAYVIYKGKGAASVKAIPPAFVPVSQGSSSRIVDRQGGLLFELAASTQPREYDWQKKGTFLLDPTECAELISMDTRVGCDMFHDPNLNDQSRSGQVTKRMQWKPSQDGKGMFLSLQISDKQDKGAGASYSVPVTWAELEVLRSLCRYSIPYFLGFHEVWGNPPLGTATGGDFPPAPPSAPTYYDRGGQN